ncbi:MAG TPA: hypothetical protein VLE96_04600 [Chlamydiales bacterium]|nr:hypothetical protein [Chlamydiales bacterium]
MVVVLFIEVEHFCHKRTAGFALNRICSDISPREEWKTPLQVDATEIRSILNQPFTFFGKGAQCYAFLSQDQNYVLKFFRFDHLRPPMWLTHFPLPLFLHAYRDEKIALNRTKTERTFESYKIAYHDLKEETGLVFVHLNWSDDLKLHTTIFDKLGIPHCLDMDSMHFILQRRAQLLYPVISQWMENKQLEQAKKGMNDLLALLVSRYKKGIGDKDPDLCTNFGFLDNRPVQIDVGRFSRQTDKRHESCLEEIVRITDKFNSWLKDQHPELSDYLQEQIKTITINETNN